MTYTYVCVCLWAYARTYTSYTVCIMFKSFLFQPSTSGYCVTFLLGQILLYKSICKPEPCFCFSSLIFKNTLWGNMERVKWKAKELLMPCFVSLSHLLILSACAFCISQKPGLVHSIATLQWNLVSNIKYSDSVANIDSRWKGRMMHEFYISSFIWNLPKNFPASQSALSTLLTTSCALSLGTGVGADGSSGSVCCATL